MSLTSYRAATPRVTSSSRLSTARKLLVTSIQRADRRAGCSTPHKSSDDRKRTSEDKNAAATRKGKRRRTSTCEWVSLVPAGCKAWRRPTLPQLKLKYHRRSLVSRPSSGWDRVGHRRYGHQAMKPAGQEVSRNQCRPNLGVI